MNASSGNKNADKAYTAQIKEQLTAVIDKSEGSHFINLSGPYRRYDEEARPNAYKKFAARVEDIIQQDVQTYLGDIVGDADSGDQPAGEPT